MSIGPTQVCSTVKENLQKTGFIERSEVYREDARSALRKLVRRGVRFRLIFLDAPFREDLLKPTLRQIAAHSLLQEDGIAVAEHDARNPPRISLQRSGPIEG